MKAIIIGVPGRGKSTLANQLNTQNSVNIPIISIGSLRYPLEIHEPHKGYETEIAPQNIPFFTHVIDEAMVTHENVL